MNDEPTRAFAECVKMAKICKRICYIYKPNGKGLWGLSYEYWDNWIFKAYPGGRKHLSVFGQQYLRENYPDLLKLLESK